MKSNNLIDIHHGHITFCGQNNLIRDTSTLK